MCVTEHTYMLNRWVRHLVSALFPVTVERHQTLFEAPLNKLRWWNGDRYVPRGTIRRGAVRWGLYISRAGQIFLSGTAVLMFPTKMFCYNFMCRIRCGTPAHVCKPRAGEGRGDWTQAQTRTLVGLSFPWRCGGHETVTPRFWWDGGCRVGGIHSHESRRNARGNR